MRQGESGSTFVVSLDLEQAWGTEAARIGRAEAAAYHGVPEAIPRMLDLAERYGAGFTWATVGLLFFDRRDEMFAALPRRRPHYADIGLCPYARMAHVGLDERRDPLHFGRSLLRRIRDCPKQEIAGHTFSHYYTLEDGGDPEAFAADLAAASAAAATLGVVLRSLVFPRNQVNAAYLPICRAAGYRSFRGAQDSSLHRSRPRRAETLWQRAARTGDSYWPIARRGPVNRPVETAGMHNLAASRFLRPARRSLRMLDNLQLARIRGEMRRAAAAGSTFHLWWHPHNFGNDVADNLAVLESVLEEYRRLADSAGMRSVTMTDLAAAT